MITASESVVRDIMEKKIPDNDIKLIQKLFDTLRVHYSGKNPGYIMKEVLKKYGPIYTHLRPKDFSNILAAHFNTQCVYNSIETFKENNMAIPVLCGYFLCNGDVIKIDTIKKVFTLENTKRMLKTKDVSNDELAAIIYVMKTVCNIFNDFFKNVDEMIDKYSFDIYKKYCSHIDLNEKLTNLCHKMVYINYYIRKRCLMFPDESEITEFV